MPVSEHRQPDSQPDSQYYKIRELRHVGGSEAEQRVYTKSYEPRLHLVRDTGHSLIGQLVGTIVSHPVLNYYCIWY